MAGIGFGMRASPTCGISWRTRTSNGWPSATSTAEHLEEAREIVDGHYGTRACAVYRDFRELYARRDLDAVSIAVPDHWHAILAVSAVRAGLDVYGEKPLTHGLREGRALCDAVKTVRPRLADRLLAALGRQFPPAAELVRNGRLGRILRVEVGLPEGHCDFAGTFGRRP